MSRGSWSVRSPAPPRGRGHAQACEAPLDVGMQDGPRHSKRPPAASTRRRAVGRRATWGALVHKARCAMRSGPSRPRKNC